MTYDVVCGIQVEEEQAASRGLTSQYEGRTYSFCSRQCKQKFEQQPQQYAAHSMTSDDMNQQTGERYLG